MTQSDTRRKFGSGPMGSGDQICDVENHQPDAPDLQPEHMINRGERQHLDIIASLKNKVGKRGGTAGLLNDHVYDAVREQAATKAFNYDAADRSALLCCRATA